MKLTEIQKEHRRKLKTKRKADAAVGKMKKTLMYIDIGHLNYDQWVAYRVNYIGGTDVPTLLVDKDGKTINPYQSKLELFHEKVGVVKKTGNETEATYSGHVLEDHIIDKYWVYYDPEDPEPMTTINNGVNRRAKRYARRIKDKMMYDPRFPFIKMNLDGFIQNTRFEKAPRGVLEIKSGLSRVWNTYIAGIPAFYMLQVQTYLLVTGLKYAEIGVLLDGRFFKVFPFEANKVIQDEILKQAEEFWDTVQEGKLIWDDPDMSEKEKLQLLTHIEPAIDGGSAVDRYLKERFRSDYKVGRMPITNEIADAAIAYLDSQVVLKDAEYDKNVHGNFLKKAFLDNQVDEIVDLDGKVLISNRKSESGRITMRVNKTVKLLA